LSAENLDGDVVNSENLNAEHETEINEAFKHDKLDTDELDIERESDFSGEEQRLSISKAPQVKFGQDIDPSLTESSAKSSYRGTHGLIWCFKIVISKLFQKKFIRVGNYLLMKNLYSEFLKFCPQADIFSNWCSQRSKTSIWTIKWTFWQVWSLFSAFLTSELSLK